MSNNNYGTWPYKFPLIVLCGIDGAGKTTLIKPLAQKLQKEFETEFLTVRYPGQTPTGQILRNIVLGSEAHRIEDEIVRQYLFATDLRLTTTSVVLPTLAAGKGVLSDRYTACNLHYAVAGHNVPLAQAQAIQENVIPHEAYNFRLWGVYHLLLDIQNPIVALAREKGTGRDFGDGFHVNYYARIAESYREEAKRSSFFWSVINAEQDPEAVFADAYTAAVQSISRYQQYITHVV